MLADYSGSKGVPFRALRTVGRSHVGTVRGWGGFSLLVSLKKWTTKLFLPTVWPAVEALEAAIAATKTLSMDGESLYPAVLVGRTIPLRGLGTRRRKQTTYGHRGIL